MQLAVLTAHCCPCNAHCNSCVDPITVLQEASGYNACCASSQLLPLHS
jgi:hypothetical protein